MQILSFSQGTGSRLFVSVPCLLHGILYDVTTAGKGFVLYDGKDVATGRRIHYFRSVVNITQAIMFPNPIYINNGLYADLDTQVSELTLMVTLLDHDLTPVKQSTQP